MKRKKKGDNLKGYDVYTAYVPHGVSNKYRPISKDSAEYSKVTEMKESLGIGDKEFIILFNNRNIRRKQPGDVIVAYREFVKELPEADRDKCVLLMHTPKVDPNGTDLPAVIEAVCPDYNVVFTEKVFSTEELNLVYNLSDVTINMASNEGFGLSTCESIRSGTPVVLNVTGGLQDQCRFTINGKPLTAKDYIKLGSLHDRVNLPTNLSWGSWVKPLWPTNLSLQGSPPTPYIYDDRCTSADASKALRQWYDMDKDRRIECGLEGSKFIESKESGMSSEQMGAGFIKAINSTFKNWEKRNLVTLWKI